MFKNLITKAIATAAAATIVSIPMSLTPAGARGFEFGRTPGQGPAGTAVFTKSFDGCKPEPGAGDWNALVRIERDGAILAYRNFRVSETGQWAGEIVVPAGTPAGVVLVTARCFDSRHLVENRVDYDAQKFEVTDKEPERRITGRPDPKPGPEPTVKPKPAPKAKPRPGTPRVTG